MNEWVNRRTALYLLFDADDRLLYVGITFHPRQRFTTHKKEQFWWPLVVRRDVRWYETRPEAQAAEIEAIREGDPVYNTVYSPSLVNIRGTWTRYLEPLPKPPDEDTEARRAALAAKNAALDRLRTASATVRKHEAERLELAAAIVEARRVGWRAKQVEVEVPYDRNHVTRIAKAGGIQPTRGPYAHDA